MLKLLFIALGGAAGTLLRYGISGLGYGLSNGIFPLGTLLVNLSGSFAIGFLWGLFEGANISPVLRTTIFIGILGGYTTFSSFALESFNLFREGEYKTALINILASNIFGIGLAIGGFILAGLLIANLKGVTR